MSEWSDGSLVFMIPIVAIIGGITAAIVGTVMRARVRELEIRERIAMIEKGLVPPPEVDPRGFEQAMNRYDLLSAVSDRARRGGARHRRAGITLLGVGFGLMVLIGVAGDAPESGVGVGGFLVILGIAFFINSLSEARVEPASPPSNNAPPPAGRTPDSMPPH
jgi:hypothetical protein